MAASDPFTDPPPEEIALARAPLVRVLAQVRFPRILQITEESYIAPFQEAIRRDYPRLQAEFTTGLVFNGDQIASMGANRRIWRFGSLDGDWRVSLADEFLVLDTTCYRSRDDFTMRFSALLGAAVEHLEPQGCDRLGIRYVDRLTGEAYEGLERMIRPEMLGLAGVGIKRHAHYIISDAVFRLPPDEQDSLRLRWGHVPRQGTIDPSTVEPVDSPSWVLDLDAFSTRTEAFDVTRLTDRLHGLAERIYTVFRWSVTDDFIDFFKEADPR